MRKSFSKRIKLRGDRNNQQYFSFLDSRYYPGPWIWPNFCTAPPGPPGALPRPATGGGATHQGQAPALPLGLGQGTLTHRSLQPESGDSPGPGQPRSPGQLATAAADGGSKTKGGRTLFALKSAADSGGSSPASTENPEDGPISRA